jgi:Class II Aldolase and Adducin N-terminal domain
MNAAPESGKLASILQPRIDYVMHGLNEGIFNHLTQVVPGRRDRYYQIPFGMHWSGVKASSFMEVGINEGEVKRGAGDVERSCYCIHAPIHRALPQAKVVFHTHIRFLLHQPMGGARGPATDIDKPLISRTLARMALCKSTLSRVQSPCLKLPFRSPRGPPEPLAPPCIRPRVRPVTAACLQG